MIFGDYRYIPVTTPLSANRPDGRLTIVSVAGLGSECSRQEARWRQRWVMNQRLIGTWVMSQSSINEATDQQRTWLSAVGIQYTESSHFWTSVLHVALYKTLFFDFWFRPPNAQNLLPKICTKSPISRLVWQIDRRCLDLPGGFRGWPIQWNREKCCGADHYYHGNEIWARRGDPVAYRLVL